MTLGLLQGRLRVAAGRTWSSAATLWAFGACIICAANLGPAANAEDTVLRSTPDRISAAFASKHKRYRVDEHYHGQLVRYGGPVDVTWETSAWRGDRVHRQVALWCATSVEGLTLKCDGLSGAFGAIPASAVSIYSVGYVKGDQLPYSCDARHEPAVLVPDVLIENAQASLPKGTRQSYWITIDVPSDTVAGNYRGGLLVSGDGVQSATLEVRLKVLDLVLPKPSEWAFHLDLWQFPSASLERHKEAFPQGNRIELWSNEHLEMLEPFYRTLASAGQKAISTYIKPGAMGAPSMVQHICRRDGEWDYDYTAFDRYVETLHKWGITGQINAFSLVGWNRDEYVFWDAATESEVTQMLGLTSPEYREAWSRFLTDFRRHLARKGWLGKTVLYMDEVNNESMLAVIDLIKSHDPAWKIGLAYGHLPSEEVLGQLYDASGLLGPVSQDDSPNTTELVRTFYTSCTQLLPNPYITPTNNPAEMTWMAWHAAAEGYDGYLRWAYDYWRNQDPLDPRDGGLTAGDFSLVYRSSNESSMGCRSSVRFELLREGIQDFEKIRLLRSGAFGAMSEADRVSLDRTIRAFDERSGIDGHAEHVVELGQRVLRRVSENRNAAVTNN